MDDFGAGAAGEPARLRSEADRKALRGPAIGRVAGAVPIADAAIRATGGAGDTKPLFVLQSVTITGAVAIPEGRLVTAYQPYIGKKVSQADLANIATGIGDIYRAAGFHLSRAIVPPQDIAGFQVRIQVIEGRITEVELKGEGAEQFGIRAMLDAVVAEQPARLATLERQLILINGRPGVRIADTQRSRRSAPRAEFPPVVAR